MSDDETIGGECARCGCPIVVEQKSTDMARHLNRILMRSGEAQIGRSEVALCDDCIPGWREEVAAEAAEDSDLLHDAWVEWRARAKTDGIKEANRMAPNSLFRERLYRQHRAAWITWWQTEGERKQKKTKGTVG